MSDCTSDSGCVIRPTGRITAANADTFRLQLLQAVNEGATSLTVDLSEVDMIDSKGLAVFIVCHQTIQKKGGNLTVICPEESLRGLFRAMRLDQHFVVKASEQE